jgi:hypothetical protein
LVRAQDVSSRRGGLRGQRFQVRADHDELGRRGGCVHGTEAYQVLALPASAG